MKHANITLCGQPTVSKSLTSGSSDSIETDIMSGRDDYIRVCVSVFGRVQGVGFRYWLMKLALELGIKGEVSNNPDGSVDAVFCGRKDGIEEILRHCTKGPSSARVTDLNIVSIETTTACPDYFRILR